VRNGGILVEDYQIEVREEHEGFGITETIFSISESKIVFKTACDSLELSTGV